MPTGFEVGKKYRKITPMKTGMVTECTYVTDTSNLGCCAPAVAVLKFSGGAEFSLSRDEWDQYEEVIEPRREFWNAYHKTSDDTFYGGPYRSRSDADQGSEVNRFGRYGVLELIHHSEMKVESIFHMVKVGK